ncbi:hypothetical protein VNO78_01764 [Psophocarpus tetragonolobus]|uniref:Uncharacterized protein n=1 Tax=Psophocarpus tetragonolobus TaxID=3891 RepID=A0AAN9SYK8_PSOTE
MLNLAASVTNQVEVKTLSRFRCVVNIGFWRVPFQISGDLYCSLVHEKWWHYYGSNNLGGGPMRYYFDMLWGYYFAKMKGGD